MSESRFPLAQLLVGLLCVALSSGSAGAQGAPRHRVSVNSLEIEVIDGFPVGVEARIAGFMPDACSRITLIEQTSFEAESRIELSIETTRPEGDQCANVRKAFTTLVPLDVNGFPPGEYTVSIGDLTGGFELPGFGDFPVMDLPGGRVSRRVFYPGAGLTFSSPGEWSRSGLEWESPPFWAARLGMRWHVGVATEPRALLPAGATVHESSDSRFGWVMGVRFLISRDDDRVWSEHAFVQCDGGLCEFWVEAPSEPLVESAGEVFWRLVRFAARYESN